MARLPKHEIPEETSINMTPLIDVVMQLLLFFMLATNLMRPHKIELALPESTSTTRVQQNNAIEVTYRLREGGQPLVALNGESVVDLKALFERLKSLEKNEETQVAVRIEKSVPYQDVISVLDTVRDAGFPRFALHTLVATEQGRRL